MIDGLKPNPFSFTAPITFSIGIYANTESDCCCRVRKLLMHVQVYGRTEKSLVWSGTEVALHLVSYPDPTLSRVKGSGDH